MIKKLIRSKHKMLIVSFILGMLFISCSSDNTSESDNSSDGVELPANLLGTYTGGLDAATDVNNDSGTATLVESGSKIYTVNFSDNVASITNITFSDIGNGTSFIFTDTDRGVTVSCGFSETETVLSVLNSNPVIAFGGEK